MLETYLKPEEVAPILRVTVRTVYQWLRAGKLESYRPYGRWLITHAQIERFVKSGSAAGAWSKSPLVVDDQVVSDSPQPLDVSSSVTDPAASVAVVRPNANPLAAMKRNKRGR